MALLACHWPLPTCDSSSHRSDPSGSAILSYLFPFHDLPFDCDATVIVNYILYHIFGELSSEISVCAADPVIASAARQSEL